MNKRELQKEEAKAKIRDAAWALMEEKGFDHFTVQDIATKAGVSVGLVYYHFKSKADVVYDSFRIFDEELRNSMPEKEGSSPSERIRTLILQYCDEILKCGLQKMKASYKCQVTGFHNPAVDKNSFLFSRLNELAMQYYNETSAAEDCAYFAVTALRGLVYDWCCTDGGFDLKQRMKRFADILVGDLVID